MISFWKILNDFVSIVYIYEIKLGSGGFSTEWACGSSM